jgi:hypothetical protein
MDINGHPTRNCEKYSKSINLQKINLLLSNGTAIRGLKRAEERNSQSPPPGSLISLIVGSGRCSVVRHPEQPATVEGTERELASVVSAAGHI